MHTHSAFTVEVVWGFGSVVGRIVSRVQLETNRVKENACGSVVLMKKFSVSQLSSNLCREETVEIPA